MNEIMDLWDRLRRKRREGMYADVINRDDPRIDPRLRPGAPGTGMSAPDTMAQSWDNDRPSLKHLAVLAELQGDAIMSGVTGYLVTGRAPHLTEFMISTMHYANWRDSRPVTPGAEEGSDTTARVMVMDKDAEPFLGLARYVNGLPREDRVRTLTVERIIPAGDGESYELLIGDPGTGWDRPGRLS